jgi:hypothetical protein
MEREGPQRLLILPLLKHLNVTALVFTMRVTHPTHLIPIMHFSQSSSLNG